MMYRSGWSVGLSDEELMEKIDDAVDLLLRYDDPLSLGDSPVQHFEDLYRSIFKIVLHGHGDMLYDLLDKHFFVLVSEIAPRKSTFEAIVKGRRFNMLRDVFMYYERSYLPKRFKYMFPQKISYFAIQKFKERERYINSVRRRLFRHARTVGRLVIFLKKMYNEITYRPGNKGAKRAREEFESLRECRSRRCHRPNLFDI